MVIDSENQQRRPRRECLSGEKSRKEVNNRSGERETLIDGGMEVFNRLTTGQTDRRRRDETRAHAMWEG